MNLETLNDVDWTGFKPSNISMAYVEGTVNLQEDDELDKVYSEWSDHVNMTASELQDWSSNPCSREASVDPEAVIKRNLRLLEKDKEDWTEEDIKDAKRTTSFISRMRANEPDAPRDGPHGCPSEWAISLLNWAFNPFDSVPDVPEDEELEPVDEISLQDEESFSYEFEPVPDQVLYSTEELAMQRAESMGLEGVHEHVLVLDGEEVTMYMPGGEHQDWVEHVNHPRQLDEVGSVKEAEKVFTDQPSGSEDGAVRVEPTTIHELTTEEDSDE